MGETTQTKNRNREGQLRKKNKNNARNDDEALDLEKNELGEMIQVNHEIFERPDRRETGEMDSGVYETKNKKRKQGTMTRNGHRGGYLSAEEKSVQNDTRGGAGTCINTKVLYATVLEKNFQPGKGSDDRYNENTNMARNVRNCNMNLRKRKPPGQHRAIQMSPKFKEDYPVEVLERKNHWRLLTSDKKSAGVTTTSSGRHDEKVSGKGMQDIESPRESTKSYATFVSNA